MKQTAGKRGIRVKNVFCKYGFVGINRMGYQYVHSTGFYAIFLVCCKILLSYGFFRTFFVYSLGV